MLIGILEIKTTKSGRFDTCRCTKLGQERPSSFCRNKMPRTWFWFCGWRLVIRSKGQIHRCDLLQKLGRWDGGQSQRTSRIWLPSWRLLTLSPFAYGCCTRIIRDAMVSPAKQQGCGRNRACDLMDNCLLLVPMSEVAGWMAVQIGAHFLTKQEGGLYVPHF